MTDVLMLTRDFAENPAQFDLQLLREKTKRALLEKAITESKRRRAAQYARAGRG